MVCTASSDARALRVRVGLVGFLLTAALGCRYDATRMTDETRTGRLTKAITSVASQHQDATVGVFVFDISSGITVGLEADRLFHAASTMKVPVMIEVFRQAASGRFDLDDVLPVQNSFRSIVDGSEYQMELSEDSDDSLYGELGKAVTVRKLVYQMITVSSNLATNILIDFVSADSVQAATERLGVRAMSVLRGVEDIKAFERGLNNTATAEDLGILLTALARREAVSTSADEQMLEILLDQQFNEMIPAGLPTGTPVAHKTGTITRIHHDAAIVSPGDDPYVLVILIEGINDRRRSAELGARIARRVNELLRPGR